MNQLPEIMIRLYGVVADLEKMFPGRHFTPDGHMVGSIGEAIASHYYGVKLHAPSNQGNDGTSNGKSVEVKITQTTRVAIRSEPEHLLVLKIHKDGSFDEIYNGKGCRVWAQIDTTNRPSNGQYQVSLARLREIMNTVPAEEKLPRIC